MTFFIREQMTLFMCLLFMCFHAGICMCPPPSLRLSLNGTIITDSPPGLPGYCASWMRSWRLPACTLAFWASSTAQAGGLLEASSQLPRAQLGAPKPFLHLCLAQPSLVPSHLCYLRSCLHAPLQYGRATGLHYNLTPPPCLSCCAAVTEQR